MRGRNLHGDGGLAAVCRRSDPHMERRERRGMCISNMRGAGPRVKIAGTAQFGGAVALTNAVLETTKPDSQTWSVAFPSSNSMVLRTVDVPSRTLSGNSGFDNLAVDNAQIVIMNNEMRPKKSIVARNGAQVSLTGQGYLGGPQGLMITIL